MITVTGSRVPIKLWTHDLASIEPQAMDQLKSVADLPWVEGMAVMPDVHYGRGATIGSVVLQRGAVSPSIVGVDIGCGMMAVQTDTKVDDLRDLATLRHSIERSVPVGFQDNRVTTDRTDHLYEGLGALSELGQRFESKARHQLGTLGGGNHFIEVCVGSDGFVWLMLHSGSRGVGNQLAGLHIIKAKSLLGEAVRLYGPSLEGMDPDLAPLVTGTPEYQAYLTDLDWCQRYARANRDEMMLRVLRDFNYHVHDDCFAGFKHVTQSVSCHHNFIEFMDDGSLLTRKGATSAKLGELGIIPGSMGTVSHIVRGLGNEDSYCSCSHGAGRRMSRGAARRTYTVDDLAIQTRGVECRKDADVVDEIPGAYKSLDDVMVAQRDLVEVVATLKAVICVKG